MRPPSQETPRLTSWPTPSLPLVCGDWHEADIWSQICGPCGANPSTEQPGLETQASSLSSGWYSWPCLELTSGSELKVLSPKTSPSHPNSFFSPLGLGSTDSTKMLVIPDLNVDLCVCVCVYVQWCPTLCCTMDCTHQAPLSMGFPRHAHWSGLPFPSPRDLSDPGIQVSCIGRRIPYH